MRCPMRDSVGASAPRSAATGPPHGEEGAEQELRRPGVRAVVDAVDVAAEPQLEADRDGGRGDEQPGEQAPAAHLHDDEHDGREEQVELLLDRQRPEVLQRAGRREQVGVARAGAVEAPVGHVGDGGEHVATEVGELLGAPEPPPEQPDHGDGDEGGGQEAAEAADPELAEGDGRAAVVLADQQVGDEEAREGEEGGDAEEPALGPGEAAVEQEHADDGEAAQPVETGQMRHAVRPRPSGGPGSLDRAVGRVGGAQRRRSVCGRRPVLTSGSTVAARRSRTRAPGAGSPPTSPQVRRARRAGRPGPRRRGSRARRCCRRGAGPARPTGSSPARR